MKRFAILVLVAAVAGGGYYAYRNQHAGTEQARAGAVSGPRAVPVEVASVELMTVSEEVEALGTLAADESVVIAPEIAGRVISLGFKEGEPVKIGQALVKLDTAILDAELKQAQADLGLARDTHERLRALVQRGSGTQVALDEAAAKLASSEARIQLAKARLAQSTIVAPFNGVVGLRSVGVGDYVSVGKQLITLTSIDPIKIDFRVPEIYLSRLKVGQPVQMRVDAVPERSFQGQIYAIDPVVDVNGRAIRLRAAIPNADLALKPGLFARLAITIDQRENAIVVPEMAVVPDAVGKMVYIVENGKAKRLSVELGKRLPGKVEIVGGLKPDMQIITAGQMRLRDGATIAIKDKVVRTSRI
ncbi:efflux RND transporter periplasmic adaptor subunit [Bosea sp. (in: a-proteobacteria)]|uniref:efflux RND transporter periplasmic adaptor subunit n=1 Tax=Bosea sp. (in: a-proteobacteria) TaxID=1871050 RepID=UPI0026177B40|nr:efflux RND transporter periplasmic adaptor subunit [Bosea sp. (in: a-proteobacteria)]MCO5089678.1 efflux RND transporter periplasmic adaptor subunit [Bosea sp. (in: a-proteobacteria)]